jgi:ribosome-binding protein aMBF1 (putative translation factor)
VTVTASEVKAARALLGWSERRLAARAGVSRSCVRAFEAGSRTQSEWCGATIREALEMAGVGFTNGERLGPELRAKAAADPAVRCGYHDVD